MSSDFDRAWNPAGDYADRGSDGAHADTLGSGYGGHDCPERETESIGMDDVSARAHVRFGTSAVEERRREVTELVKLLRIDPQTSLTGELFLCRFSRLQVALVEFFAREEEMIGFLGLSASEKKRHMADHDRLLGLFNRGYCAAKRRQSDTLLEVYEAVMEGIVKHVIRFDAKLLDHMPVAH